jgi:hypothetical protein
VLTGFAVIMIWFFILSLVFETDWIPADLTDWDDTIVSGLMLFGLTFYSTRWSYRAIRRPNWKSDRVVLLICIFMAVSIPVSFAMALLPEAFLATILTVTLLFWTPAAFWVYRKLEAKWTADQEIYPLEPGVVWPSDRHFLMIACFFFWTACTMGIVSLSDYLPENFAIYYGTLLPMVAAVLIYRLGKRLLK